MCRDASQESSRFALSLNTGRAGNRFSLFLWCTENVKFKFGMVRRSTCPPLRYPHITCYAPYKFTLQYHMTGDYYYPSSSLHCRIIWLFHHPETSVLRYHCCYVSSLLLSMEKSSRCINRIFCSFGFRANYHSMLTQSIFVKGVILFTLFYKLL